MKKFQRSNSTAAAQLLSSRARTGFHARDHQTVARNKPGTASTQRVPMPLNERRCNERSDPEKPEADDCRARRRPGRAPRLEPPWSRMDPGDLDQGAGGCSDERQEEQRRRQRRPSGRTRHQADPRGKTHRHQRSQGAARKTARRQRARHTADSEGGVQEPNTSLAHVEHVRCGGNSQDGENPSVGKRQGGGEADERWRVTHQSKSCGSRRPWHQSRGLIVGSWSRSRRLVDANDRNNEQRGTPAAARVTPGPVKASGQGCPAETGPGETAAALDQCSAPHIGCGQLFGATGERRHERSLGQTESRLCAISKQETTSAIATSSGVPAVVASAARSNAAPQMQWAAETNRDKLPL